MVIPFFLALLLPPLALNSCIYSFIPQILLEAHHPQLSARAAPSPLHAAASSLSAFASHPSQSHTAIPSPVAPSFPAHAFLGLAMPSLTL